MEHKNLPEPATITRRNILIGAGKTAPGIAGLSAFAAVAPGTESRAHAVGGATEKWPWPYVKLDPEKTAEIAYGGGESFSVSVILS